MVDVSMKEMTVSTSSMIRRERERERKGNAYKRVAKGKHERERSNALRTHQMMYYSTNPDKTHDLSHPTSGREKGAS